MSPTGSLPAPLPPLPALSQDNFVSDVVDGSSPRLEALLPAADDYRCSAANAPQLLFVPGLGMDGVGFVRQLPLGALAHIRLFQTPNDGIAGESGLGHAASHVERYIAARGLDRAPGGLVLAGSSMGGAISMLIAMRARVRVRALVLISTFGSCRHLPRWQRIAAPLAWLIPFGWLRRAAWRAQGRSRGNDAVTPEEAQWMINCRIRRNAAYFGRNIGALTRWQCLEELSKLALPSLVVHGSDDNVLPLAAGEELHRTLKDSTLVRIERARHTPFFTHANQVNAAVAKFISELA